ncbi:hypothetical protein NNO_1649 [Hydrogenimonas sp.]|nr:hypothetical protein NNO_1649 [Hydrogenimonas sp.]
MILPRESDVYGRMLKERRNLMPITPFIKGYKEIFTAHFIEEIRKEIGSSKMREKFLFTLSSTLYDALFDFKSPVQSGVVDDFLNIKNRGIVPLLLLQKLLSSFTLRLVSDYADDRDLFRYLATLSLYFDAVQDYLKSVLQADVEHEFATNLSLKPDEVEKWLPSGRSVRLLNVYKGIPVIYDAVVGRSSSGSVVLQMPAERGVVAEREGRVVCFDRRMEPFAIEMKIERVAYSGKVAVAQADNPSWIDSIAQRRKRVRVSLDTPLKARITALGRQFDVDVIDISGKGVCLQADVGYGLPLYEQVEVTLPIPQEDGTVRSIAMRGSLQYISPHGDQRRRYHIFLHANPRKEAILSSFVSRCELSLMKEIKSMAGRKLKGGRE